MREFVISRRHGVLACSVVLLGLWGCARVEVAPPSPQVREQLTVVRVVPVPPAPATEPDAPVKGAGAGARSGAKQGAWGTFAGTAGGACYYFGPAGCAVGIVTGIALTPVGGIVGAVVGSTRVHSAEEVEKASANLRKALTDATPHLKLRDAVIETGLSQTTFTFVPGEESDDRSSYSSLFTEGVDTVLELTTNFFVELEGEIDPDLTLRLDVQARIVRATDGSVLYQHAWGYKSPKKDYFDMSVDDAALMRAEMGKGTQKLAAKIVYDLFIRITPERLSRSPSPREGAVWTVPMPPSRVEPGIPATTSVWNKVEQQEVDVKATQMGTPERETTVEATAEGRSKTNPGAGGCLHGDSMGNMSCDGAPTHF